ncbi:EAL domain-containing protein [uncultured Pseudokineococcus sp.]|uniref:EAL domain-containing protein n=1 Tax=uncultured Pseudokineococcus sp. TaxID=1642928 RepID=UPI0026201829|nr:EAL domain-containing protein [uncultured Pseudokineococcus sp.]
MSAPDFPAPQPVATAAGRVADRLLSSARAPWRTWRRRQAVLTSALALAAALLAAAVALPGTSGAPRGAGGAAAVVLVLLAVGAAPLLLPGARVGRGPAASAGAAGLVLAALALGALADGAAPAALGVVLAGLVAVLVVAHRAPGPLLTAAATAALGPQVLAALGLPGAPGGLAPVAGAVGALAAAVLVARAAAARRTGTATGGAPGPRGPELVTAPDRDSLRDLLVAHLLAHPGQGLALLLVGLVPSEGRDGAGTCADELLRAVTTRTAGAVRDGDVVVRLPEGELAVLVTGGTAESARRVGERVRAALSSGVVVGGALVDLETSIGAGAGATTAAAADGLMADDAAADRRGALAGAARCADRLLAEVDAALEVARGTGTGVAVVDPGEREGARLADLAQLRADLQRALADDAGFPFRLCWRPRFDVRGGRWTTATAELEWAGASGAGRPPQELAAGTTMAPDLFQLLLRQSLRAVVAWRAAGVPVQAAVRVPGEALGRPGLVDLVTGSLAETGAQPADLRLLVEDDDVAADPSAAAVALARLAVLGAPASVTGLGANRSSVAGLGALPVDEVVVDARLVASLRAGHEADARLVRAVVGLGHGLGLRVVAAGVDDAGVHRAAVALGCDAVEGEHVGARAGSSAVAGLVLGGQGADLLAPARRPSLPAPRRHPGA